MQDMKLTDKTAGQIGQSKCMVWTWRTNIQNMSCIFRSCKLVRHFHVLHFHVLQFGPSISCPAFSRLGILMAVIFRSSISSRPVCLHVLFGRL